MTVATTTVPGRSAGDSDSGGFFQYHGAWAPGVRLFRRLRFRMKAALITLAFAVPLAVLAIVFFKAAGDQLEFSRKEREGVAYNARLVPLLLSLQHWRSLPADAPMPAEIGAQLAALEEVERLHGADLGTPELHATLRRHHGAASAGDAAARDATMKAALALVAQAADGSNLTLDPDIDSFYLMDGSLFQLPDWIDDLAALRDHAATLAGSAALTSEQARAVGAGRAMIDHLDESLAAGLKKTGNLRPALVAALRSDEPRTASKAWLDRVDRLLAARERDVAGLREEGDRVVAQLSALQGRMLEGLDTLLAERIAGLERNRLAVIVLLAAFLPLAGYLFYSFYLVMDGGLQEVQRHLQALTGGDLTTALHPWGRDEAADLMLALSEMQGSLRGIVGQVRVASDQLVQASSEIAHASTDLSGRSEDAAASLEESAASLEQILQTVRQTADAARAASALSTDNAGVASRGRSTIDSVVTTMEQVQRSSSKVADIIGVIDGIAFQTNLLALNAAVEAARAGEQGKGFAVVAGEVRALAQRSANAAREIKGLIQDSGEQVGSGSSVVAEAGRTMGELLGHAERMRDLLGGICTGATEQAAGVGQVGAAVQRLDQQTQQNAALVEQTAAAASALRDQAVALSERVARFRLPASA